MTAIKKMFSRIYVILLIILLNGCFILNLEKLEHENDISIIINENEYSIFYVQLFDSSTFPFYNPNQMTQWGKIENENEYYLELSRTFDYNDQNPFLFLINSNDSTKILNSLNLTSENEDVITDEPINISSSDYVIFTNYKFETTFKSRRMINELQSMIGEIDNPEFDILETYENIIEKLISQLYVESINNSNIEWNKKNIYLNGIRNFNQSVNISEIIEEFKDGEEEEGVVGNLNKLFIPYENFLFESIDPNDVPTIKPIWNELKTELYISLFLIFNNFSITVDMPGHIISNNADFINHHTVINKSKFEWEIDINDFSQNDYKLHAKTRIVHINRIIILLFIIVVVSFGLILILKKKK